MGWTDLASTAGGLAGCFANLTGSAKGPIGCAGSVTGLGGCVERLVSVATGLTWAGIVSTAMGLEQA